MTDYHDGPRAGIADFEGQPHLYRFDRELDEDGIDRVFVLRPLDSETVALALEDWDIWQRWRDAFHRGDADLASHPALPADRSRHEELSRLLAGRFTPGVEDGLRKVGRFRTRGRPAVPGRLATLEVCWGDLP